MVDSIIQVQVPGQSKHNAREEKVHVLDYEQSKKWTAPYHSIVDIHRLKIHLLDC